MRISNTPAGNSNVSLSGASGAKATVGNEERRFAKTSLLQMTRANIDERIRKILSMSEWLNEQRLQKAANLLVNSYLSVKEVAYSIGYEHPSSFIRAFERRFAQAPAQYRKQSDNGKC